MKVSMSITPVANIVGEQKALELVAKAGFDYFDYDFSFRLVNYNWATGYANYSYHPIARDNYIDFVRQLKKWGEDNGITCHQTHAPFPIMSNDVRDSLKKSLDITAELGAKICVIHPDNFKGVKENTEMHLELLPFAKELGVKIATENMWNWSKDGCIPAACSDENTFLEQLKAVDDPNFIACVDVGHAELKGLNTSAEKIILNLGDYVQALHLHDVDFLEDLHDSLFSQKVDFVPIVNALKTINYKGVFSLEVSKPYSKVKPENLFATIEHDYKMVRKLADMFEGKN